MSFYLIHLINKSSQIQAIDNPSSYQTAQFIYTHRGNECSYWNANLSSESKTP